MFAQSGPAASSVLSRRDFLVRAAIGVAGVMAHGSALALESDADNQSNAATGALVGSNIYGWGQYAERDGRKLDIDDVISALRDTGYDYLEAYLDVARPDENGRFAERLKAKGLKPVSLYLGARLHDDKAKEVVSKVLAAAKVCSQAGFKVFSCNVDPIGREKTDQELNTQLSALTELGAGLKALGIHLGVHQHMPEMANHAREFHYNFRNSKPELVGWCYDVHWVWKGGVMPLDALREYGQRVVTWHLRQSRNAIWWEQLDSGDIDYAEVALYSKQHHLPRRYSVELALEPGTRITRSAIENHRLSREFVRRIFES